MEKRNFYSRNMERQSDDWLQMCISNPEKFEPLALQAAEWEIERRTNQRLKEEADQVNRIQKITEFVLSVFNDDSGEREMVSAEIWARSHGFKTSDVILMIEQKLLPGGKSDKGWYVHSPALVGQLTDQSLEESKTEAFDQIIRDNFRRWFLPRYDEVSLFVMSGSALFLFVINTDFRDSVFQVLGYRTILANIFLYIFLTGGFLLSLIQGFIRHEKLEIEREMMLVFALFIHGFCGMLAGFHLLENPSPNVLFIFPAFNIFSGFFLIMLLRFNIIGVSSIIDTKVSRLQITICILPIVVFVFSNHYILNLHWTLILSMSVLLAGVLSNAVDMLTFGGHRVSNSPGTAQA